MFGGSNSASGGSTSWSGQSSKIPQANQASFEQFMMYGDSREEDAGSVYIDERPDVASVSDFPTLGNSPMPPKSDAAGYKGDYRAHAYVDDFPVLSGGPTKPAPLDNDTQRSRGRSAQRDPRAERWGDASPTRLFDDIVQEPMVEFEAIDNEQFGLKGLLKIIRMSDPDLNTLALGTDLTTLGLNLNSTEYVAISIVLRLQNFHRVLYPHFNSPFAETPSHQEPEYHLPECYYKHPPALKTSHLSKFSLETLFYIFYSMPQDTLQAFACKELYAREWRYQRDLKLWFTQPKDATMRSFGYQPNSIVYFDTEKWESRVYLNDASSLTFMTIDEVQGI